VTAATPLEGVEGLDSLFVVSFLQFLENERGAPLPIYDDGGIPVEAFASVRTAYELVTAPK
jgi:acyl carrier protein